MVKVGHQAQISSNQKGADVLGAFFFQQNIPRARIQASVIPS
jgi:hypothetical protein